MGPGIRNASKAAWFRRFSTHGAARVASRRFDHDRGVRNGRYTAARIDPLEGLYKGLFLKAHATLGVQSFGVTVIELDPGSDAHPDHDHSAAGQEGVFVVLRGTGAMTIEGETIALDPETIVRVGPEAKRKITAGPEGMRLKALGGVPARPTRRRTTRSWARRTR